MSTFSNVVAFNTAASSYNSTCLPLTTPAGFYTFTGVVTASSAGKGLGYTTTSQLA